MWPKQEVNICIIRILEENEKKLDFKSQLKEIMTKYFPNLMKYTKLHSKG